MLLLILPILKKKMVFQKKLDAMKQLGLRTRKNISSVLLLMIGYLVTIHIS